MKLKGLLLAVMLSWAAVSSANNDCIPPRPVQEAANRPIRLAYSTFNLAGDKELLLPSIKRVLNTKVLGKPVEFQEYSQAELDRAIQNGEVDIVLSSSGQYRRNVSHGLRSLATVVCDEQPDPNRNEGALIIVHRDSQIHQLGDLKGKKLVANAANSFSGYQIPMREIARIDSDWEEFFGLQYFFNRSLVNEQIVEWVSQKKAEVGFLSLCSFEQIQKRTPELLRHVRIINEQYSDVTSCRHSTQLYPSVTVAVTPSISATMSRAITVELLKLPKSDNGLMWSVASDFKSVDDLLKDLKLGPFEYLRHWGIERVLTEYWMAAVAIFLVILGLFAHSVRAAALVRRKEREMKALVHDQLEQKAKLDRLQKAGAVGQISSLVAHELRQPLGAISLYAQALENLQRTGHLDSENLQHAIREIINDAQRASDIVERVRSYAKSKTANLEHLDSEELIRTAIEALLRFDQSKAQMEAVIEQSAIILANRLDIEMALINIIKNAREAAVAQKAMAPKITIVSTVIKKQAGQFLRIEVKDNGPKISDQAFENLNEPISSEKPEGLGLGLAISRNIIESIGGRVVFIRNEAQEGLTAIIEIPCSQQ